MFSCEIRSKYLTITDVSYLKITVLASVLTRNLDLNLTSIFSIDESVLCHPFIYFWLLPITTYKSLSWICCRRWSLVTHKVTLLVKCFSGANLVSVRRNCSCYQRNRHAFKHITKFVARPRHICYRVSTTFNRPDILRLSYRGLRKLVPA